MKSASLLPIQTDAADVIRFEKNLLQIGFFAANDSRKGQATTRRVEQQVMRNGNKLMVAAEFRGSEVGLPSTADRDKFIAFLKIAQEDKARNGLITNPIRFSGFRMIRELGLSRHGDLYDDIMRWGKRMTDTTITSEQVVYLATRKVYSDEVLHVFRNFRRSGSAALNDSSGRQESFEVVLEDWLLDNLNERYVIPEDFNTYKLLKRATAKGIFGYLHVWFYASLGGPVEKDYVELCNLLDVQSYKHISKIKETMGRALDELVQVRYLSQWDIQPMLSKRGYYKLVLSIGDELSRLLRKDDPKKELDQMAAKRPALTAEQNDAARLLMVHAIADEKAREFVEQYGKERVQDAVEYVESQLNTKRDGGIGNPAGLIIYILKNNLPVPPAITEGRKQRHAQTLEDEYRRWTDKVINDELAARLPDDQLGERVSLAVSQMQGQDSAFRKLSQKQQEAIALQYIRKELLESTLLPTFEEWAAGRSQYSLKLS